MVIQLTDMQLIILALTVALFSITSAATIAFYWFRSKNKHDYTDFSSWHLQRHLIAFTMLCELIDDYRLANDAYPKDLGELYKWAQKSANLMSNHQEGVLEHMQHHISLKIANDHGTKS